MRVLVVAPRLDIGGAEIHLTRVLPALRCAGVDVSLFLLSRGGQLESTMRESGVPIGGRPVSGSRLMRSLRAGYALRREVARLKPDIVHFFMPEAYLVGSAACIGLGDLRKIMSRRSLANYQRNHPALAFVERQLHKSMTALLGNSTAVVTELVGECRQPDKVGLIHNGIDIPPAPSPERRAAARCKLGIPGDAFVIVMIANLISYKGHDDVLRALGRICGYMREPWRLVLMGRDEGIGARLKEYARALGIADNILWFDQRLDTQTPLDAADLGVLASHQEGFSNSLLEKMAHALPVIATAVGGNIDAVADGVCGRLVPVKDWFALGDAILALHDNAELRARFGAAGRRRVERVFSLDVCIARYRNLYRGIGKAGLAPLAQIIDPPATSSHEGRS